MANEPVDKITVVRNLLRENPDLTAKEVKTKLALPSEQIAATLITTAKKAEQEMQANLANEDELAANPPPVEKVFYVRDRETSESHKAILVGEKGKNVVLEFEDPDLKIVR